MFHRARRTASLTAAYLLAAAVLAAPVAAPVAARPVARPVSDEAANAAAAGGMFTRLNDARVAAGLRPYRHSPLLAEVAAAHAREVAEHNHFSHTGRDGRSAKQRMADAGYGAGRTGVRTSENFVARATVDEGFAWLMSDADHRPNMMDARFREVGVGVAPTRYGFVWVLDFGTYDGVDDAPPTATAAAAPAATATDAAAATGGLTVTAAAAITSSVAVSGTMPVTAVAGAAASDVVSATDPVTVGAALTDAVGTAVDTNPVAPTATPSTESEPGYAAPTQPATPPAPRGSLLLLVAALLTVTGLAVASSRRRLGRRP